MNTITREQAGELLAYDPDTGKFTWLKPPVGAHRVSASSIAGCIRRDGYRVIGLHGRDYKAHRLAFLLVTGAWPVGQVDHINGDKADNRWSNLRDVRPSVNRQNLRRATAGSKTGLLGATPDCGRYRAQIELNGRAQYLGLFDTAEAAHAAYLKAKRQHHQGNTL
jgi:hypothetical protein